MSTTSSSTPPPRTLASYTASGVEQTYTYLIRGGGCDPWRLALQDDTAAWWPGGNTWDVNADSGYGSTLAIVDGVLTITQGPMYASRQLAVRGTSHGEAALPMEIDDWEIEARYRRGGQEPPLTGDQSLAFTWAGSYLGGILFDHPGYGPCVRVLGDGMDTLTKMLTPLGAWGRIKVRRLDGVLYAKEWAESADEPEWEVSTPASDLEEPDDVFRVLTNFGADERHTDDARARLDPRHPHRQLGRDGQPGPRPTAMARDPSRSASRSRRAPSGSRSTTAR